MVNVTATDRKIAAEDYELWKTDFTWDALHGLRYGQSFCNRFRIADSLLFYNNNHEWCDKYIQSNYIE